MVVRIFLTIRHHQRADPFVLVRGEAEKSDFPDLLSLEDSHCNRTTLLFNIDLEKMFSLWDRDVALLSDSHSLPDLVAEDCGGARIGCDHFLEDFLSVPDHTKCISALSCTLPDRQLASDEPDLVGAMSREL